VCLVVLGVHRGHPDDLPAESEGGVHGEGVQPAGGVVQSDSAVHLDLRHGFVHEVSPVDGWGVVVFDDDASHAGGSRSLRGLHCVH